MSASGQSFISEYYMPEDLCDEIVNLCSGRNRLKLDGTHKNGGRGYLSAPLERLSPNCFERYTTLLMSFADTYTKQYPFLSNLGELIIDNNIVQTQFYDKNFYYKMLHCENDHAPNHSHRVLVFMTYCNTIDDDGGTEFPYQNLITKPKKGLTLIWPAYWTHPHVGVPSKNSTKVITTGWFTTQQAMLNLTN
jgi:prolyl 4-hydroxylase